MAYLQVADEERASRYGRVIAHILNKHCWRADKRWSSGCGGFNERLKLTIKNLF
jgi:hypothetical protein